MIEKPVVLFGNEKHIFDFEVLFWELNIDGYLVEERAQTSLGNICETIGKKSGNLGDNLKNFSENRALYDFKQLAMGELRDKLIVVCEQKTDALVEKLEGAGASLGQDYLFVADCFFMYNPIFLERKQRKLVIWGAGAAGREAYAILSQQNMESEIAFYVDANKSIEHFLEIPVKSPEEIADWKDLYVVAASYKYQWEIYEQLEQLGMEYRKDYVHVTEIEDHSDMLQKVFFSESRYPFICNRPFGTCDIITGRVYLCCPDFLGVSVGNMKYMTFDNCWSSYLARLLRLSVCNGTYAFCDKQYCDKYCFDETSPAYAEEKKEYRMLKEQKYPGSVMVGIDKSCNLKCPSCRKEVCVVKGKAREELFRQAEELLEHVISNVDHLWLAGNGEVFFSPVYRAMLKDERCKKRDSICIMSNGTLFNEKNWELLKDTYKEIYVVVSMDGIRDETIEKLRLGADAKILKANLRFLGNLRKDNQIKEIVVNFVLQTENIAEMEELLQFCKDNHIDRLQILRLNHHTVISEEDFNRLSVFDKEGTIKEEYRHYFTEELVRDKRIDWFNNAKLFGLKEMSRIGPYDLV